jgi:hypothetical protein
MVFSLFFHYITVRGKTQEKNGRSGFKKRLFQNRRAKHWACCLLPMRHGMPLNPVPQSSNSTGVGTPVSVRRKPEHYWMQA